MPALNPVTQRQTIKHRWDGKTFHVKIFDSEYQAQHDTSGPWYDNHRTARAFFDQTHVAAPPPPPVVQQSDPAMPAREEKIADVIDGDHRAGLFREAKRLGVKVFGGIKPQDLEAKIMAAMKGEAA